MKTKLIYTAIAAIMMLGFSSCNLDYFPSDELGSDQLLQGQKGAQYVMDGCYAVLKDEVEHLGYASGNSYIRHFLQLSEFPADNICLSSHTTDPLYEATAYMMTDGLKNVGTLWMLSYKVIFMCNSVIETLDSTDVHNYQLLGEAYFMRGLMHMNLVTLFAKPYSMGVTNPGVPYRKSTTAEVKRDPVGDVYEYIAEDLTKAAKMMGEGDLKGASRGNKGYPCKDAALGVLSRVYLYMGKYNECINTVNEMLNGATPASKLDPDITKYFQNTKTSQETLFCVAHELADDPGQSSVGSMFLRDEEKKIGWGEIYPSNPLLNLYERYPEDLRYSSILAPQYSNKPDTVYIQEYGPDTTFVDPKGNKLNNFWNPYEKKEQVADTIVMCWHDPYEMKVLKYYNEKVAKKKEDKKPIPVKFIQGIFTERIYFPDPETPNGGVESGRNCLRFYVSKDGSGNYVFNDSLTTTPTDMKDYVVKKNDNKGTNYSAYQVTYKGEVCEARIVKNIMMRNTHPMIYVRKFSYQDESPMLSSPALCRWGEVILNLAEAYARTGQDNNAIDCVDAIRTRAGIPAAGLFKNGMQGYSNVIDVVMDERRMELAFEGFRTMDVYRNQQNMDRRYPGAQPWKIVEYTEPHIQYPIPNEEWTVSGIEQNPGY